MTQVAIPFSIEQLAFLKAHYGINPLEDAVQVADGIAHKKGMVWFKGSQGPEKVSCSQLWRDILEAPQDYFINKPKFKVEYLD